MWKGRKTNCADLPVLLRRLQACVNAWDDKWSELQSYSETELVEVLNARVLQVLAAIYGLTRSYMDLLTKGIPAGKPCATHKQVSDSSPTYQGADRVFEQWQQMLLKQAKQQEAARCKLAVRSDSRQESILQQDAPLKNAMERKEPEMQEQVAQQTTQPQAGSGDILGMKPPLSASNPALSAGRGSGGGGPGGGCGKEVVPGSLHANSDDMDAEMQQVATPSKQQPCSLTEATKIARELRMINLDDTGKALLECKHWHPNVMVETLVALNPHLLLITSTFVQQQLGAHTKAKHEVTATKQLVEVCYLRGLVPTMAALQLALEHAGQADDPLPQLMGIDKHGVKLVKLTSIAAKFDGVEDSEDKRSDIVTDLDSMRLLMRSEGGLQLMERLLAGYATRLSEYSGKKTRGKSAIEKLLTCLAWMPLHKLWPQVRRKHQHDLQLCLCTSFTRFA